MPDDDVDRTESLEGFTAPPKREAAVGATTAIVRGARIGRYVIDEVIGAGGMGVVYRAHDPALDRALAIKLVRNTAGGSDGRARLVREAHAMAKLRHPNVIPIFDVGAHGDEVFVVMPFLEGGTLGAWMRDGARAWRDVIARFTAAGRGLAAAHAAGLVHRDFKPDNVLLDGDGEVVVADLGLARLSAGPPTSSEPRGDAEPPTDLTGTGVALGTPAYMAPEQIRGEPSDARADQFSFCVALWEALYGRRPFDAGALRGAAALTVLLDEITAGRITAPPGRDVPGWLRATLERGLRAEPDARWSSMQALLTALGGPRRRRGLVAGAIGAAVVAGGVAIAVGMSSSPGAAPSYAPAAGPLRLWIEPGPSRGDVETAALSPDGRRLAVISGGRVVLRDPDGGGVDTVLADGMRPATLDWSPDGRHLLVSRFTDDGAELVRVDVATHAVEGVGGGMYGGFVTDDEVVVAHITLRQLTWLALDGTSSRCDLPDDVVRVGGVDGLDADTAVIRVTDAAGADRLLVYRRDCTLRATIEPAGWLSFHVEHRAGIVTVSAHDDGFEVRAWSADGTPVGAARIGPGAVDAVVGRVDGADLLLRRVPQTILLRHHDGVADTTVVRAELASFAPSPDGQRIAWIERTGTSVGGVLRLDAADRIGLRAGELLDRVEGVAWSPDGRALAVIVDDGGRPALLRVDPVAGTRTPLALDDFDRDFAPVWLDDHRVAVLRVDHRTFAWIDVDSGARGDVIDPTLGSTSSLVRSPRDGTLAFDWDQGTGGFELWTMLGDHRTRLGPLGLSEFHAIAASGALLVFDSRSGALWELDPRTGARTEVSRHPLASDEELVAVAELPGGDRLLTIARLAGDVVRATPR